MGRILQRFICISLRCRIFISWVACRVHEKETRYEFTLTEDLHGIGDVRDSVEWDKYNPAKGWLLDKCNERVFNGTESIYYQNTSSLNGTDTVAFGWESTTIKTSHIPISTHFVGRNIWNVDIEGVWVGASPHIWLRIAKSRLVGWSDALTNAEKTNLFKAWLASEHTNGTPVTVVYQLATPTRTPLTFTKNNSSTATELPMQFLTDIPSVDYPAEVFDAEGSVTARGKNLFDISKVLSNDEVTGAGQVINNGSHLTVITTPTDASGVAKAPNKLSDYAKLKIGETYILTATTTGTAKYIYLSGASQTWRFGTTKTITQEMLDSSVRFYASGVSTTAEISNIQIELGSVATPYEPYRPEVSAPIPALRSNAAGTVYDEFEVKTGKLTRKIGRIESYNGEDVGENYISTTGGLDAGATVIYELAEPVIEQYEPVELPTYPHTTIIEVENETPAEAEITAVARVIDADI